MPRGPTTSWEVGIGKGLYYIWGGLKQVELEAPPSTLGRSALLFFCMGGSHFAFCLKKGFHYQKKALRTTPQGWFVSVLKLLQIKLLPYLLQCRIGVQNLKMLISVTTVISHLAFFGVRLLSASFIGFYFLSSHV